MIGCGIRVFAVSSVRAAANCCAWMKGRRFVLRAKTPGHDLGRGHGCGRLDMWRRVLRFPQAVVRKLVRVIHASVHALCVAADGCETGACMFVSVARHDRRRIAAELLCDCVQSLRGAWVVACGPFGGQFALLGVALCAEVTRGSVLCLLFLLLPHTRHIARREAAGVSPDSLTLALLSGGRAVGRARVTSQNGRVIYCTYKRTDATQLTSQRGPRQMADQTRLHFFCGRPRSCPGPATQNGTTWVYHTQLLLFVV